MFSGDPGDIFVTAFIEGKCQVIGGTIFAAVTKPVMMTLFLER